MIELKNVKKIYNSKKSSSTIALDNINFKIGNKGMLFIVGKSGSGKSTLLNLLGGLDSHTSGQILINNKDISKFANKDYDSYRNTYVGFIFQEFNVLEQYNVYENIELSLKLQNNKVERSSIDQLLTKLGIEGLGTRKINELSGGQKQRVAIARAIIKNPEIILADEPTGNLDQKSSEQIFNILKEISKEKLVIVVSHDMDSALKYADRIIEISDGKVISDSNPVNNIELETFKLKKSKLPLSYALKMAINSFKAKPFKLFMTILLTTMSLIFMGFTINCALFNNTLLVTKTMQNNKNYNYYIYKTKFGHMGSTQNLLIKDDDLQKIEAIANAKLNLSYSLFDSGNLLSFQFGKNNKTEDYYKFDYFVTNFIEISDERILGKVIGKLPQANNEIVVHKYFADYAIKFGIKTIDDKLYFPKDYNDFVNSNQKIKLDENAVVIVGIIDDDDNLYKKAKETGKFESDKLKDYFYNHFVRNSYNVYVKGFTDNVKLKVNKYAILDTTVIYNIIGKDSDKLIQPKNIKALEKEINIMTKDGLINISKLSKEEVILSIDGIKLFDKNFDSEFNKFLSQQKNTSYDDSLKLFLQEYLKNLKLKVGMRTYQNDDLGNNINEVDLNIVGVSFDNNNYVSYSYVEEYEPQLKTINFVKVYDDNIKNLTSSLNKLRFRDFFPEDAEKGTYYSYTVEICDNYDLANIMGIYKGLTIYILIVSLVFVLFTFLLFSNFIGLSISYCKKEIGILRAIGATSKDVIKIFGYESIIIAVISWFLSIIGWFKICDIMNHSMFDKYYVLEGIITHPLVPILMFLYTIAIALLITIVSVNKITRIKPIDAILNK